VSATPDIAALGHERRRTEIAVMLRAECPMIASVSLRPHREKGGFDAGVRLDPIVIKGSYEQQGYPQTPEAATRAEARRLLAIEGCVERVNANLVEADRIRSVSIVG
jgi:hypothetical protein